MYIDIYRRRFADFIAVPCGNSLPEGSEDMVLFKSIDLRAGAVRISIPDPDAVLAKIEEQGWSRLDETADMA